MRGVHYFVLPGLLVAIQAASVDIRPELAPFAFNPATAFGLNDLAERTPLLIDDPASGYVAWFKADGILGLADGDSVSLWDDAGPNNKDATQSTAALQPIYKTNAIDGKPAIRFDGLDDRLVGPGGSGIWGLSNHFTVFAVVRLDASPGSGIQDVVGSSSLSNNLDLIARRDDANGNWLAYNSSPDGTRNSDFVLIPGTWYILTWRLNANAPKHLQIRADKVYRFNDTGYTGIGTAPSAAALGARNNGANPLKGDIAEVIFYSGSLSDTDMIVTENYLRAKYGFITEPPPAAPTALQATPVDHQRIDLSWSDNATTEGGYRIERREGQTGTFTEVATVGVNEASFINQPLAGGTEYCYQVLAYNTGGDSNPSNIACATTSVPPPDPYGNPAAGYVARFKADGILGLGDGDPVNLWDDASPNNKDATQSTVSLQPIYKTNAIDEKPAIRFDGIDDRLVAPTGSGVWGLSNHFTVFAVVRLDASPGSGSQDVVGSSTLSNNLDLIARRDDANGNWLAYDSSPDGTRNSDFVLIPGTWYILTWRLNANAPKHLQIRADKVYRLNDTGYMGIGTAPSMAAIGARNNGVNPFKGDIAEVIFYTGSLSDADLTATEDYLRAKYGFITEPPPAAPTGLAANGVGHQRIDLFWTDNASNEGGFRIERREGQTGSFAQITTVGANVTSLVDQPLAGATEYCYRVFAYNAGGGSDPSNIACATTSAPSPNAPTNLIATAVTYGRVDLSWTDNSSNETGFQIERREGTVGEWAVINVLGANAISYIDSIGVLPDAELCYRVKAAAAATEPSSSNTSCTTTPSVPPVSCSPDDHGAAGMLAELLDSDNPQVIEWKLRVGLANADLSGLSVVSDDNVCEALWANATIRSPTPGFSVTFFQLAELFIITEYPEMPPFAGLGFTTVLDSSYTSLGTMAW